MLDSFTYVYNDNLIGYKNQVSKTETVNVSSVGTTTFEYDEQSCLTKAVHPNGVQNTYTYDDAGNRLTKTSTSVNVSVITEYTYFGYDNNGNQMSKWTQLLAQQAQTVL